MVILKLLLAVTIVVIMAKIVILATALGVINMAKGYPVKEHELTSSVM